MRVSVKPLGKSPWSTGAEGSVSCGGSRRYLGMGVRAPAECVSDTNPGGTTDKSFALSRKAQGVFLPFYEGENGKSRGTDHIIMTSLRE